MTLGFNKLNGRYVWIAIIISLILLAVTFYAQNLVKNSAAEGYSVISENTRLLQKISNINFQIQKVESNVLKYTTSLDENIKFNADRALDQLHIELLSLVQYMYSDNAKDYITEVQKNKFDLAGAIDELENNGYRDGYEKIEPEIEMLVVLIKRLNINIKKYFEIMTDVKTRYPGMPHLLKYLSPNNTLFSEAVESALQESNMIDAQIGQLDQYQYQIVALFQSIRYAWAQKISSLRIMISNRMGAFGDPEASMNINLINRSLYADSIENIFLKLDEFNKKGLLGLQQEESLDVMHKASKLYEYHFNKVIKIYLSENWRADLPMLKNIIDPNFKRLRKTVEGIESVINANANKGITTSLITANLLTQFIWVFTTGLILLMAGFYVLFNKTIRQPVIDVANALDAEARGEPYTLNINKRLVEIKLLDRAFNFMREQVRSRQQRLEAIFSNAAEGIITVDTDCKIESINEAGLRLFDLDENDVLGKCMSDLIFEYEYTDLYKSFSDEAYSNINFEGEVIAVKSNNVTFPLMIKLSQMQVGSEVLYILIVQDISEQKSMMNDLQHVAEHDALTGLYNRQYYSDNLEKIIEISRHSELYDVVCMFLDLDNFKYINDTLGHMAGDRLLKEITELLRNRMRKTDLLARIGGDEFSLIFQGIQLDAAIVLANEYRECIADYKFTENGRTFSIGCSIGLAAMTADVEDKDELLSRADVACHEAKRKGKNCIHAYESSDKEKIDNLYVDMGWSQRIKDAIENNSFVFASQKICCTVGGSVFAEEYLIRLLDNEEQGIIMPAGFLNSAERFGLMPDIDKWVVSHALESYALRHKNKSTAPCISINLSAKSVGHPEIFDVINESITKFKIAPEKIIFEITEDVAIADFPNAIIFLNKIRAMGCTTALDDFGAGYSSFSYLKEFPVDYVKIDGSFIVGIEDNKLNYALVKAMHDVCATLNKKTVVEFVENKEAHAALKTIGVDYVQGFYIAKPKLLDGNENERMTGTKKA